MLPSRCTAGCGLMDGLRLRVERAVSGDWTSPIVGSGDVGSRAADDALAFATFFRLLPLFLPLLLPLLFFVACCFFRISRSRRAASRCLPTLVSASPPPPPAPVTSPPPSPVPDTLAPPRRSVGAAHSSGCVAAPASAPLACGRGGAGCDSAVGGGWPFASLVAAGPGCEGCTRAPVESREGEVSRGPAAVPLPAATLSSLCSPVDCPLGVRGVPGVRG